MYNDHEYIYIYTQWNTRITIKPDIPDRSNCYKQEFVIILIYRTISHEVCTVAHLIMRSLLCYVKKFVIEEFFIEYYCTVYILLF